MAARNIDQYNNSLGFTMVATYANHIIRWRWLVILFSLIWVAIAATGNQYLTFTNDYRAFFHTSNPQLQAFEAIQDNYAKSDNVVFVVTPKDGQVFTEATLNQIQWLTEQAWQIP